MMDYSQTVYGCYLLKRHRVFFTSSLDFSAIISFSPWFSISQIALLSFCFTGIYCKWGQWWATSWGNNTWYDIPYRVSSLQLLPNWSTISDSSFLGTTVFFFYMNLMKYLLSEQYRYYVSLQKIYQAKAESDCFAMEHHVKSILKRIGRDPESISRAYIKTFCKNTRKLRVRFFISLFITSFYGCYR
jgi:hypothetical protein